MQQTDIKRFAFLQMTSSSKQLTEDQKIKLIDSYKAQKVIKRYQRASSLKLSPCEMSLRNVS